MKSLFQYIMLCTMSLFIIATGTFAIIACVESNSYMHGVFSSGVILVILGISVVWYTPIPKVHRTVRAKTL